MDKKEYRLLLNDPRWIARRLEILERDNYTCSVCGCDDNLQVHHRVYEELAPWEYKDEDLVTMCDSCHNNVHQEKGNTYRNYIKPYKFISNHTNEETGEITKSICSSEVTSSKKILLEIDENYNEDPCLLLEAVNILATDISNITEFQNSGRIKINTTISGEFEATVYINIFFKKKLPVTTKPTKVVDKKLTKKQIAQQTSDAYFAALKAKKKAYADKVKAEKEAKKLASEIPTNNEG